MTAAYSRPGCDLQRRDICAPAPTHMIERRLPHLDDFTIHTGLEHAIAVQSTAKMPNLPAQLPVLLLQRKNMRDACEIDTLVLAQLLRLRKTRHVTKRVAPRTTLRALRHHQTKRSY